MGFDWKLMKRVWNEFECFLEDAPEIGGCRVDFGDSLPSQTHPVLKIFSELPPVRGIKINLSNADAGTVNAIRDFTDLVEFQARVEKPASFGFSTEWNQLKVLSIAGPFDHKEGPFPVDIAGLSQCHSLRKINLMQVDVGPSGYEWIGQLQQLTKLGLGRVPLDALTLNSDRLKVVELDFTTIGNEIGCLADCSALTALSFQGATFECDPDIMLFIRHSNIEEVNVAYTNFDDSRLKVIRESNQIKRLDLRGAAVTASGIEHLISLSALSEVSIEAYMLNAESIRYLTECNALESLWVFDCDGLKNKSSARATIQTLRAAGQWCKVDFIGPEFE